MTFLRSAEAQSSSANHISSGNRIPRTIVLCLALVPAPRCRFTPKLFLFISLCTLGTNVALVKTNLRSIIQDMEKSAKRVAGFKEIDRSSVCYWNEENGWWVYLPSFGVGMLSKHTVVEHEDGTITVTPSILMHRHKDGKPSQCHGYITKGVWRDC